jgi:hypothetical protein
MGLASTEDPVDQVPVVRSVDAVVYVREMLPPQVTDYKWLGYQSVTQVTGSC